MSFEGSDLLISEPASLQNLRSWVGGFPDAARFGGMSLWTIIEVAEMMRSGDRWSRRVKSKGGMYSMPPVRSRTEDTGAKKSPRA